MSFADAPSRDRLGFLMVTLTRQWRRFVEEQLAASGLTDATWTPLLHLRAWGDGVTQKELAERVGLDGSSLVRLLDILEGKGWVERRADAADRRSKRIFLTPQAIAPWTASAPPCSRPSSSAAGPGGLRGRSHAGRRQQDSRPHRADARAAPAQAHPGTEERA
jgi:MarR family transcriptional regulator for hemolysin